MQSEPRNVQLVMNTYIVVQSDMFSNRPNAKNVIPPYTDKIMVSNGNALMPITTAVAVAKCHTIDSVLSGSNNIQ